MRRNRGRIKLSELRRRLPELAIVVLGLISIHLVFLSDAFRGSTISAVLAGQLGDFVGGYIGSVFGLLSVVFLYSTLRSQLRASEIQEFTDKYYQLIALHRSNVAEIQIGNDSGRKVFVVLFREFRAIYDLVSAVAIQLEVPMSARERLSVSYYVLFFGVGPRSSKMLEGALEGFDEKLVSELVERMGSETFADSLKAKYKLEHKPFDGHLSLLGHYYRHLYQTVTFVDKQTLPINKYEYVKTVRAQLSHHEQVLLLLNSLTPVGRKWLDEELLSRYRLVKNIPRYFFADEEIDLVTTFPPGYFEWEER